jgi:hypothetical protein
MGLWIFDAKSKNNNRHVWKLARYSNRRRGKERKNMKTLNGAESEEATANAVGVQILNAIEWVYEQNDSGDHNGDWVSDAALHRAFLALYRREPDAAEEQAGLWSLCCAACPHCGMRPGK